MDATHVHSCVIAAHLTEFLTAPHNQRMRIGTPGNLLVFALLLAVGLVLMPRGAEAHGRDHAGHHQQYGGRDAQYHGNGNQFNGSQVHDRSAVPVPLSAVTTHCPGGPGSTCCCHEKTAAVNVPLTLGAVAQRVLLVPLPLQHQLHFSDARPFVSNHLLDSSPPRAPPASL
jgi:hypothetical protein